MSYILKKIEITKFSFNNKSEINKQYELNPQFGRAIRQLNDLDYEIRLAFKVNDAEGKSAPFDIDLEILGVFSFPDINKNDIDAFMKYNATSIIFPYLRSALSSAMSALMVPPIFLPVVDSSKMFNDAEIKNE